MDDNTFRAMMGANAVIPSQQEWTTPGTYEYKVPANATFISAVCVAAGEGGSPVYNTGRGGPGGCGGNLRYGIRFDVTPGEILEVVVGAGSPNRDSAYKVAMRTIIRRKLSGEVLLIASNKSESFVSSPIGGNIGGGDGGYFQPANGYAGGGGCGAGGYSGDGGVGGSDLIFSPAVISQGTPGAGGAGAGGNGANAGYIKTGGGGVGLRGEGSSGQGNGAAGSGGTPGVATYANAGSKGGKCGGGGSAGVGPLNTPGGTGEDGGARIIVGGGRAYPSTNTHDM